MIESADRPTRKGEVLGASNQPAWPSRAGLLLVGWHGRLAEAVFFTENAAGTASAKQWNEPPRRAARRRSYRLILALRQTDKTTPATPRPSSIASDDGSGMIAMICPSYRLRSAA